MSAASPDSSLRSDAVAVGIASLQAPGSAEQGWLHRIGHWWAEAVAHAFGNPREEAAHQPPLVGVQPYRDRPRRRR